MSTSFEGHGHTTRQTHGRSAGEEPDLLSKRGASEGGVKET